MSLINVSHLTFSYEGSYENIFEDVSFRSTWIGSWDYWQEWPREDDF